MADGANFRTLSRCRQLIRGVGRLVLRRVLRGLRLVDLVVGRADADSTRNATTDARRQVAGRHRGGGELGLAFRGAAGAFGRDQVLLDDLQQLGDAELVHAGPQIVSFGAEVFVHALGEPDRDNAGRFRFGVGGVALFTQLDQPLLDLFELLAAFEGGEFFEAGERAADHAVDSEHLAEERDPVGFLFVEPLGGGEDLLVLLRGLSEHGVVSFQSCEGIVRPQGPTEGPLLGAF